MKLLIYSHFFAPSIGGVETIVQSLALGLAGLRDLNCSSEFEITLVMQTPAGHYGDRTLTFRVVRQPGFLQLFWRLNRNSDIVHAAGAVLACLKFVPEVLKGNTLHREVCFVTTLGFRCQVSCR